MSLEEKIKDIIADQLGVKKEEVKKEASFEKDLGADSLPDDEAESIITVGGAINYLNSKVDPQ